MKGIDISCEKELLLLVSICMTAPLSELICFYSDGNHERTDGFLMISGEIEVNSFN